MGTFSRIKKYKSFFVDKAGNNIDYTTFVYAEDYDEALARANNIMKDMNDDTLVKAIVVLINGHTREWNRLYR